MGRFSIMQLKPIVGRHCWYWPGLADLGSRGMVCMDSRQPFTATIAFVWNTRTVNLEIIDHTGRHFDLASVILFQADETIPANAGVAQWMPYQQTQAAREAATEDFK